MATPTRDALRDAISAFANEQADPFVKSGIERLAEHFGSALAPDDVRLEAFASWTGEDGAVTLPPQAKASITAAAIAGSRSTRFVRDLLRTASD